MSSPQVSSSISLPLPLFYHPVRQFSIIISTFLLLRAMLDKIRHTRIVAVCLPGQWWTLNNQLWRVWEGLHILSSQSPPSEGGGAWRWGNEREHVKRGMKQAGVTGLKSEGCRQQKRWEDYEIPPPALKKKKNNNCQTNSGSLLIESIFYSSDVQQTSVIQTSLQLIQLVGVSTLQVEYST